MMIVCAVGVPLPSGVGSASGERFPCERCGCGCSTAEACWRDCCCYSAEQKLAWAHDNDVVPPEFVLFAAAQKQRADEQIAAEPQAELDARIAALPPCCRARALAAASCASSSAACGKAPAASSPRTTSARVFGLAFAALRCRGVSVSVGLLPPALPAVAAVAYRTTATSAPVRGYRGDLYSPPSFEVTPPPPDCACA